MKEDQLREDQRREALARREDPSSEETLPPVGAVQPAPRFDEPARPPRVEEPAPPAQARPRPEPEQPQVDPKALLESAGLVMIETKAAAQPVAEEPQQLGRPRRERQKPAQSQEDELVQIETKR
jgi:hypothetical protein